MSSELRVPAVYSHEQVTTPPFHSDSKIIANRQLPRLATWVAIFSILFRCPSSLEACDETAPRVCKPYFRIKGAVLSRILPYCLGYLPTRTAKDVYLFNISQLVFLTAAIVFVHLWLRRRPSTIRTSHQHDHASERPPPATEEVSDELSDEKTNQIAHNDSEPSKSSTVRSSLP